MENLIKETEIRIEDYIDFKKLLETYGTSKECAVIIEQINEKIKELQIQLEAYKKAKIVSGQSISNYREMPHYKQPEWTPAKLTYAD